MWIIRRCTPLPNNSVGTHSYALLGNHEVMFICSSGHHRGNGPQITADCKHSCHIVNKRIGNSVFVRHGHKKKKKKWQLRTSVRQTYSSWYLLVTSVKWQLLWYLPRVAQPIFLSPKLHAFTRRHKKRSSSISVHPLAISNQEKHAKRSH